MEAALCRERRDVSRAGHFFGTFPPCVTADRRFTDYLFQYLPSVSQIHPVALHSVQDELPIGPQISPFPV